MQWLSFFKENKSYSIFYFMFRICFDLFVLNFRIVRLKSVIFLVNRVIVLDFVTTPSTINNNYGTQKNLKKQRYPQS